MMKRKVSQCVTPDTDKKGTNAFQMISWSKDKSLLTLVQFVGDHTVSVDFPHGNSKKGIPYHRSAPSLIRDLEVGNDKPFRAYQNKVFNAPTDKATQKFNVPRNITQIRNARQNFKKANEGVDSFSKLNRLALEYADLRLLMTVPDLVLVSMNPDMLDQVKEILRIDYDKARQKQLIGYDTQFNLGDYYVSWLTIRDVRFRNIRTGKVPVIPAIQVIHERKLQLHHEIAWKIMANLVEEISTKKHLATSDDEFTELLEKFVHKGFVGKCEIHGTKKIERWVRDHGGNKDDQSVLKSDFRNAPKIKNLQILKAASQITPLI